MAYNLTRTTGYASNVNASFRAGCQLIHDTLLAGGWIQTSDTGQIDIPTATAPGNASAGYEIWRSNESGGGVQEIYLRIDYIGGNSAFNQMGISVITGWASNGSGTITTGATTRTTVAWNSSFSSSPQPFFVSAGEGFFTWWGQGFFGGVIVDRLIDNAGNKLNELGFIYFYYLNAVGYQQQSQASSYLLGAYTQITTIPNLPTTSSSLQFGRAGIGFFFVQKAGFSNPLKSAIMNGAATSTISQLYDIVQIKMYGNYVNYMIVGSSFAGISSTALLRTS